MTYAFGYPSYSNSLAFDEYCVHVHIHGYQQSKHSGQQLLAPNYWVRRLEIADTRFIILRLYMTPGPVGGDIM